MDYDLDNFPTSKEGKSHKKLLLLAIPILMLGSYALVSAFNQLNIFNVGHVIPSQPPAIALFVSGEVPVTQDCGLATYSPSNTVTIDWGNITAGNVYTKYFCLENIGNQPWNVVQVVTGLPDGMSLSLQGVLAQLPPAHSMLVSEFLDIANTTVEQDFNITLSFA